MIFSFLSFIYPPSQNKRNTVFCLLFLSTTVHSVEDSPRSGRPITVRTEENIQLVSEAFAQNPQLFQRCASFELGISGTSLQHLMQDLNLKPYKPRLLQALNEDDPDR